MLRLSTVILSLALAGCAAIGPRFSEDARARAPIPPGHARLVVFRTADSSLYSGRAASLTLDGRDIGSVRYGSYLIVDVLPGQYEFRVEMWDAPGHCDLAFDALLGKTSYFEISPRAESFRAGLFGLLLFPVTPAGALVGSGVSLGGMAAESSGKKCGGAFSIMPVEPAEADRKLSDLRSER